MLFQPQPDGPIGIHRLSSPVLTSTTTNDIKQGSTSVLPAEQMILHKLVQTLSWLKWIGLSMTLMLAGLLLVIILKPML
jgi:lysophospholipase L1-like esterase